MREEDKRRCEEERRNKAIERQKELDRNRRLAEKEYWKEQERNREREKNELIGRIGLAAYQRMIDKEARLKEEKALCELEAKIAHYKVCDEYRKDIAERKAKKSAARDDSSTPSYPKSNCEYVPLSSTSTSYQYSGYSTPQSSANSPQSTTSDPSYGPAQVYRTQQDNNAIRRD